MVQTVTPSTPEQPFLEPQHDYAVLDDDPLAAEALASLIRENSLGPVIWTSTNPEEARRFIQDRGREPDVLVLDMSLGILDGPDWCQDVRRRNGRMAVLAVTAFPLDIYTARAAMSGAQGIVSKADRQTLVRALKTVARGGTWGPKFESAKAAHIRLSRHAKRDRSRLSPREQMALTLRSKGMNVSQIATYLHVTPHTVESFLGRARKKLGADTIAEAMMTWQRITEGM